MHSHDVFDHKLQIENKTCVRHAYVTTKQLVAFILCMPTTNKRICEKFDCRVICKKNDTSLLFLFFLQKNAEKQRVFLLFDLALSCKTFLWDVG